jgi:hypothetical protein
MLLPPFRHPTDDLFTHPIPPLAQLLSVHAASFRLYPHLTPFSPKIYATPYLFNQGVLKVINLGGLYARFQKLVDKGKPRGKRSALATILLVIFLAKVCGEDKPNGIAE